MKIFLAALLFSTIFFTGCEKDPQQVILDARLQEPTNVGIVTGKDYIAPQRMNVGHNIYKSTEEVYLIWITGNNTYGYEVRTRWEVSADIFIAYQYGDEEIDITPAEFDE